MSQETLKKVLRVPPASTGNDATVLAFRGPLLENRHTISVAVVDPSARLVASRGNPTMTMLLRSTAKPFQAQTLFTSHPRCPHPAKLSKCCGGPL